MMIIMPKAKTKVINKDISKQSRKIREEKQTETRRKHKSQNQSSLSLKTNHASKAKEERRQPYKLLKIPKTSLNTWQRITPLKLTMLDKLIDNNMSSVLKEVDETDGNMVQKYLLALKDRIISDIETKPVPPNSNSDNNIDDILEKSHALLENIERSINEEEEELEEKEDELHKLKSPKKCENEKDYTETLPKGLKALLAETI